MQADKWVGHWNRKLGLGGQTCEISIKCAVQLQYYTNYNFLVLMILSWSCRILILREPG